jgi:undecaprenyl-diphosphatase
MILMDYISGRDHSLMRRVNRWRAPRWIRLWALWATRGGDGWLWWTMGLLILLFGGDRRYAEPLRDRHGRYKPQ